MQGLGTGHTGANSCTTIFLISKTPHIGPPDNLQRLMEIGRKHGVKLLVCRVID